MSITVALSVVLAAFPSAILAASRGVDPSDLVQFSKDDAPSNVELPAKPPAG